MNNKKHPSSGWIKHESGQPRPVPVEWIKAVKRAEGSKHVRSGGAIMCIDGSERSISILGERKAFDEDWDYARCDSWQITHYRLKKKYRAAYEKQQEQEMPTFIGEPAKPLITRSITSTVSVIYTDSSPKISTSASETIDLSCTETGRSITLDKAVYDDKTEVVDHWLSGGEVEFLQSAGGWFLEGGEQPAFEELGYRIKPRQPAAGEVWVLNSEPHTFVWVDGTYYFASFDGASNYSADWLGFEYAAPSVKVYIARELVKEYNGSTYDCLEEVIDMACNYD